MIAVLHPQQRGRPQFSSKGCLPYEAPRFRERILWRDLIAQARNRIGKLLRSRSGCIGRMRLMRSAVVGQIRCWTMFLEMTPGTGKREGCLEFWCRRIARYSVPKLTMTVDYRMFSNKVPIKVHNKVTCVTYR